MPSTSYLDPGFLAWALQTRTDETGAAVIDNSAIEGRLPWSMFTEGIRGATDYAVTADGSGMAVTVGSGVAFDNLAIVSGDTPGQGNYGIMLQEAEVELTVPAANLTNPRTDEVYLVVVDDPGTMVKARLGYRQGDAAATPADPGPDASWDGYLLLAKVVVAAGATVINFGDVSDWRAMSVLNARVSEVEDGSIGTLDLANQAVTGAKLGDGSVSGAKVAGTVATGFEVDNSTEVATAAITPSTSTAASLTLTIPATWGSWKCYAIATGLYDVPSGQVIYRIRVDGVDQQAVVANFTVDGNNIPFSVVGRRTGMTTTGVRTISLIASASVAGDMIDLCLYARAVRTS